mmetsp:Transcript_4175/g.5558  ORF Transcript_4175/g.5558 Transcript_4175/m.5558 type:complete len:392 (+) Transcript_4175:315-1490(+)
MMHLDNLACKVYNSCIVATDKESTAAVLRILKEELPGYAAKLRSEKISSASAALLGTQLEQVEIAFASLHSVISPVILQRYHTSYSHIFVQLAPIFEIVFLQLSRLFDFNAECHLAYGKLATCTDLKEFSEREALQFQFLEPYAALQSTETWEGIVNDLQKQDVIKWENVIKSESIVLKCEIFRLLSLGLYITRELLVKRFAFSVPNDEALDWMQKQKYSCVVEIGCGKAYWSSLIRQMGIKVVAQDIYPAYENKDTDGSDAFLDDVKVGELNDSMIQELLALAVGNKTNGSVYGNIKGVAALLFCWVPKFPQTCEDFLRIISAFNSQQFKHNFLTCDIIVVGDNRLCGSPTFWTNLQSKYELVHRIPLPRFIGYLDSFEVYRYRSLSTNR